MNIVVRQIEPGDASALLVFYNGLSAGSKRTFRPLGDVTTLEVCKEIVRDNAPETETRFDLVALHEGRIVGWGFVWDLWSEEPTFGLAVADAYRRKGLGSVLIDRVLAATRRRGLDKVYLTVVQDNRVACKMYEKRGFVRYGEFVGGDGLAYFGMAVELERGEK